MNAPFRRNICYTKTGQTPAIGSGDRRLFERRLRMAIITISRGSYSKGKEIAEKVAQELNYEHTSRDVLLEASEHFNVPEI
jgi:hypothetical protein